MRSILLVTEGFPYGTSEQSFLQSEYQLFSKEYNMVIMAKKGDDRVIQPGFENERIVPFRLKPNLLCLLKPIFTMSVYRELFTSARRVKGKQKKLRTVRTIFGYAANAFSAQRLLENLITGNGIDAVYTYWCTPVTLAAIWLKKKYPSLKVVTRFHGKDLFNERLPGGLQPFRQLIGQKADRLVFACDYGKQYFSEHWGMNGQVSYLGTKPAKPVEENPKQVVIVSCSNLIPLKRVEKIIQSLAELDGRGYGIEWYHIGDGEMRKELEKCAENALGGTTIKWHFTGFINNDEIIPLYEKIQPWLFITTSSTEGGVPVSIQEALSVGIPCVGTDVGGIPDAVVDGKTGFLVDNDATPKEIAAVIERYLHMPEEMRAEYRAKSHRLWKERFNAEKNAVSFAAEMNRVINSLSE